MQNYTRLDDEPHSIRKFVRRYRVERLRIRRKWRQLVWPIAAGFLLVLLSLMTFKTTGCSPKDNTVYEASYVSRVLLAIGNETEKVEAKVQATKDPKFPEDLFTQQQRRNGAIVLHILGLIYMFVALAIVCDEFFIPSLDVITERLEISEDVAGATFMAAGGSAPELFTSVIGVFISFDDVGIGTIVGSAVFNILFVLSMCAIFSKTVLELTWWPLFRDVSFYSLILISLVICFEDGIIYWYEALILLIWYSAYVLFMKYNETLEQVVKRIFTRAKVNKIELAKQESLPHNYQFSRKMSTPILHGGSKFRQGVLQLMIHSIDPLYEEPVSLALKNGQEFSKDHVHPPGAAFCPICGEEKHSVKLNTNGVFHTGKSFANGTEEAITSAPNGTLSRENSSAQEIPEPLDVSWPFSCRKRLTYLLLAPIIFPLWATLPDVRRSEKRKWFAITFVGSILWIAFYSYLMVWWATLVGETFHIQSEIMGLTFLAAGTSIPDLITSVLVARKGLGDMAVSSSVGSNIFDVTVGLPLPWLISNMLFGPVKVNSSGMICSVILLFFMLLFVIITIASFKWRLNLSMAIVMFILYFFFLAFSLMLEKGTIKCSSIIGFFHF